MESARVSGFALLLLGVWILAQTLLGDLTGRILSWGVTADG